jgi:hypothetical protein
MAGTVAVAMEDTGADTGGTGRAEEAGLATVAVAMEDTVGAAMEDTGVAATAVTVAATVDIAMAAVDMGTASTLATEATVATVMAAVTGTGMAVEDTTAVVITAMGTAIGAVADTTVARTGVVQYSALDLAMSDQGRFATTRTGIRYRVMYIHRMGTEVAGQGRQPHVLLVTEGVDWIDTSGAADREPHCK